MLSSLIPSSLVAWRERRRVFREIAQMAEEETWKLALSDTNPVNMAKVALSLGDRAEALSLWREAMNRYPSFAKTNRDSLEIMLGLGLFDEAETIMLEGMKKSPRDSYYAGGYAEIAERRGDFPEALRRWKAVLKRFHGWWKPHVHTAICLRQTGQWEESDATLGRAIEMFRDSVPAWIEWGRSADFRKDWDEAIRRWDALSQRFTNHSIGEVSTARALEEAGRVEEAEARYESARNRYPLVTEIYIAQARMAYGRGDTAKALEKWAELVSRFPLSRFGYEGELRLRTELAQYPEAEAVALKAIDRFPAEPWPLIEYAALAEKRGDWEQAALRWAALRTTFPDQRDGYARAAEALSKLGREPEAADLRAAMTARGIG